MSEKELNISNVEGQTTGVASTDRTPQQLKEIFETTYDFISNAEKEFGVDPEATIKKISKEIIFGIIATGLMRAEEQKTGKSLNVNMIEDSPAVQDRINSYVKLAEERYQKSIELENSPLYMNAPEQEKKKMVEELTKETDEIYKNEIESRFPNQEQ